ncbi:hypothetical protein V2O64_01125 [Verrucomicrobiaceae bacterium 227]
MKFSHLIFALTLFTNLRADESEARKSYPCRHLENPPYGVTAWANSEMVKAGDGKESRFVPYNSEAAKKLILDATTLRDVSEDPSLKDHETSFYMAYDRKGWSIYIHCQEPEIASFVDDDKDVALELFFSPGLHAVPYYQMMISQSKNKMTHYDWGMPHRHYRSLKEGVKSESLALDSGYATFIFIPWEKLYDRLPLDGKPWRFSLMRWGPSVTWGGQVHDTGNFGLVEFEEPDDDLKLEIRKHILRRAWANLRAKSKKAETFWSDEKVGDLDFYEKVLKPVIAGQITLGESLGKPNTWDADTVKRAEASIDDWMEFDYKVSELRSDYLLNRYFSDEN